MFCGEDLFHFCDLEAMIQDIDSGLEFTTQERHQQRAREIATRGAVSSYLNTIRSHNLRPFDYELWDLVFTFSWHCCSDPRDRVFGLLALADSESREAFSPDYTKSATAVLLQLIENRAKTDLGTQIDENSIIASQIISTFTLSPDDPDIATIRQQRRTALYGKGPFSDAVATTSDRWPPAVWEDEPCSSDRPLSFDVSTAHGIVLKTRSHPPDDVDRFILKPRSHCTVWKNDAGEIVGPFCRHRRVRRGRFSVGQGDTAHVRRLRTPDGSVVGLANKQIQHGDTIFFFDFGISALVVRRGSDIATIVGQCIFDSDIETCQGGSGCVCGDPLHVLDEEEWIAWMSPEDLLMFISQDPMFVHRQRSKSQVLVSDISVQLEESRERLTTGVTVEEFSSYATWYIARK